VVGDPWGGSRAENHQVKPRPTLRREHLAVNPVHVLGGWGLWNSEP